MLRHKNHIRQRGMTLVELMIGVTIGLLVMAIVGTVFINILRSSDDTLSSIKLNQEVRGLLGFMVSDVRRAGYWENAATAAVDQSIDFDNPLTNRDTGSGDVTDISIHDGGSCLMYSYDLDTDDDDAYVSDGDAAPLLGYRLNANGQVEATTIGALVGVDGQTDACDASNFETITYDRVVNVTDLSFSTEGSSCINRTKEEEWTLGPGSTTPACETIPAGVTVDSGDELLEIRQIRITITAQHQNDNDITTSLSETVTVRNNRLLTQP